MHTRVFTRNAMNFAQLTASSKTMPQPKIEQFYKRQALPEQDLKVSRLPNDLMLASKETNLPMCRIAVAIRAGARHEAAEYPGLTHALRTYAALSTKECTGLGLSRNLGHMGAHMRCVTTREETIYILECMRDKLDEAVKFFAAAVTQPEFRHWEVKDAGERFAFDVDLYKAQPELRAMELLHKAAFRGGLCNSLYAPAFAVPYFSGKVLKDFVKNYFTANRMSIVSFGTSHEQLSQWANSLFHIPNRTAVVDEPSRYGGGEVHHETLDFQVYASVATEGAPLNRIRDVVALNLLAQIVGTAPHIKYSGGYGTSRLVRAASEVTHNPFGVGAMNISYSDSGLFGFNLLANSKDAGKIVKACMRVFRDLRRGIPQEELNTAKIRLKSAMAMAEEGYADQAQDYAQQLVHMGKIMMPSDAARLIDEISMEEVMAAAGRAANGYPSVGAVGNLSYFPRLDQVL